MLEDGQVIENGTHLELMALQGKYHKLFSTQAERYIAKETPAERPHPMEGEHRPRPRRPFPKKENYYE